MLYPRSCLELYARLEEIEARTDVRVARIDARVARIEVAAEGLRHGLDGIRRDVDGIRCDMNKMGGDVNAIRRDADRMGGDVEHIRRDVDKMGNLKRQVWIAALTIMLTVVASAAGIQQMTVSAFQMALNFPAQTPYRHLNPGSVVLIE